MLRKFFAGSFIKNSGSLHPLAHLPEVFFSYGLLQYGYRVSVGRELSPHDRGKDLVAVTGRRLWELRHFAG